MMHTDPLNLNGPNEMLLLCRTDSCAPEDGRISCGCTLAPPGEYDWTISVRPALVSCPKQPNWSRCRLQAWLMRAQGINILVVWVHWRHLVNTVEPLAEPAKRQRSVPVRLRIHIHMQQRLSLPLSAGDSLERHNRFSPAKKPSPGRVATLRQN